MNVPELIPSIKCLLLNGQYNWAQVLIVREVVPVFCSVEVLLICLLFHGGELEAPGPLPLFLDGCFLLWSTAAVVAAVLGCFVERS